MYSAPARKAIVPSPVASTTTCRPERPLSFAGKRERADGDDRAVVAEFDRVCVRVEMEIEAGGFDHQIEEKGAPVVGGTRRVSPQVLE